MKKTRKSAGKARLDPLVLPCPFCGASGGAVEHRPNDAGVLCHGCGVWMPSHISTEPGESHGALEMWNRRQNKEMIVGGMDPSATRPPEPERKA